MHTGYPTACIHSDRLLLNMARFYTIPPPHNLTMANTRCTSSTTAAYTYKTHP